MSTESGQAYATKASVGGASPTMIGALEHWQFDSFRAGMRAPIGETIRTTVRIGAGGRVESMDFPIDGPVEWGRVL